MKAAILALLLIPMVGCTDAGCAKATRYGNKNKVQLWSGGKVAQDWISSGRVSDDESGSGFYFVDSKTNKMVRVQGAVSVEEIE